MTRTRPKHALIRNTLALSVALGCHAAVAQEGSIQLEEIIVTAQKREQNLQEVPISVSTLSGEAASHLFEGGEDIRALSSRIPSLYAESSNGRLAPRFYIRGLGNTDFDLAASQPVSVVVDEVVLENVILKSFPLFDIARVEVLRGPQGTLFGRNTPAGIVKFETVRPSKEFNGYVNVAYGTNNTINTEGAIGGGLGETVSARLSLLYQDGDDWIDNDFAGGDFDETGAFTEKAYRAQLLWEPSDDFGLLFNIHGRDLDGTSSIFHANIIDTGSSGLNDNFDRDSVQYDEGHGNPQEAEGTGGSVRADWDFAEGMTLTSITAYETVEDFSEGDIDGGFGADFLPFVGPCQPTPASRPCIPFPSHSQDGLDDLDQFTQELRVSSGPDNGLFWQVGAFYFDSQFEVTTLPFFAPPTTLEHTNESWAVFGQLSYDVSDRLTLTGGLRWTDDEKEMQGKVTNFPVADVEVSGDEPSWDLSALYQLSDNWNVFARVAEGFRAPTIQGRDVAFFGAPTTADSETITSGELGFKGNMLDNRVRFNSTLFYYEIEDQQLTAVGGAGNSIQLVNAEKGTGYGIDLDLQFLVTENFDLSVGYSWNDTEMEDSDLAVPVCGSGQCTPLDPLDAGGRALVDGNRFPQSPEYLFFVNARLAFPMGDGNEIFFATDWFWQGETQIFLYESEEFQTDGDYEGGMRAGYSWCDGSYEAALFGRNITDEENLKGAIDFNNNSGFVNEGEFWGVSFRAKFH